MQLFFFLCVWQVLTSSKGAIFASCQSCTYLPCIFDESSCLLLDARHIWIGGVYQRCDFSGPYKAVLGQWPAQIQPWSSQVSLHRPVSVWGAIDWLTRIVVHQLWHAGCPHGCLNHRLNEFYFRWCQETDHICSLEVFIVALVCNRRQMQPLLYDTGTKGSELLWCIVMFATFMSFSISASMARRYSSR